ncbi:MAG: DUF3995 domain-containing protein [Nocardioides sp.]|nr:DUF3995 domain-containing protein [Nocardioides sp.]
MTIISGAGATTLAAIGALHVAWGAGTPWPMATRRELADAVIGNEDDMPPPAACYAVGAGLLASAALVIGVGGGSTFPQAARWTLVAGLATRAAAGGEVFLVAANGPDASERFRHLDTMVYRPLCLALAGAAATSALTSRRR